MDKAGVEKVLNRRKISRGDMLQVWLVRFMPDMHRVVEAISVPLSYCHNCPNAKKVMFNGHRETRGLANRQGAENCGGGVSDAMFPFIGILAYGTDYPAVSYATNMMQWLYQVAHHLFLPWPIISTSLIPPPTKYDASQLGMNLGKLPVR